MKKYGIFYGSATGSTATVAESIAKELGVAKEDIKDVSEASPSMFGDYETLILGTSTWGDGEVQEDWYDMLAGVQSLALEGKKIAIFGCGDETMADTFCDGVGELYKRLLPTGATFIGDFDAEGYDYRHTSAEVDGKIVGLLLDQVNHSDLTEDRIHRWVEKIKNT